MKKTVQMLVAALSLGFAGLFGGCATQQESEARSQYDLGMLPAASNAPAPPPLSIAAINAPAWLDSRMMYYRLAYANDQQARPYANSRWTMSPPQLFGQRLKERLGQAGGAVLSTSDGVMNMPVLRVEVDDFTQVFTSPGQSVVRINVRASVLNGRALAANRSFTREVPAPTPDAAGGARALADSSDAIITEMMHWLAGLRLTK